VCAPSAGSAGVWLRDVFVSRVFVGGRVCVLGTCVACTSLDLGGLVSLVSSLGAPSVRSPLSVCGAQCGWRRFAPGVPQYPLRSPLPRSSSEFGVAGFFDAARGAGGCAAAGAGGGRCLPRKRAESGQVRLRGNPNPWLGRGGLQLPPRVGSKIVATGAR
jgi:hypothetical protein